MALQHALIRIDPARYAVVERELLALRANSAHELAALYKACDRQLSETVVQAFTRAFEADAVAQRRLRASLLAELVPEKSWDLDKALPYLAEIVAALPQLRPLRPFTQLTPCDVRIDKGCLGDQHGGLVALWNADALRPCLAPLDTYNREEIAQKIANSTSDSATFWKSGEVKRLCRGVDSWTQTYIWAAWEQVTDAVREVVAEDAWLGCSVS